MATLSIFFILSSRLPVLTMEYLFGLEGREPEEELEEGEVQPAAPPAAELAMTDGPSRREVAAALLRSLPGIKPTKLTGGWVGGGRANSVSA